MTLPVQLQNASDQAVSGTLRVVVIDHRTVEPAGLCLSDRPVRPRREFTLTFGPGTYNAHYPVHVYAEFEYQEKSNGQSKERSALRASLSRAGHHCRDCKGR